MGNKKVYNWQEVREFYDQGNTMVQTMAKFGFYSNAWGDAKKRGDIIPRKNGRELHSVLQKKIRISSFRLKNRLIEAGLIKNECSMCGMPPLWQGKELSLHLDHKNGNKLDNTLDNLRILCPNCHQQTDTWGSKRLRGTVRKDNGCVS